MSHPLPVLTLSELCGLRLVLTGGRKTNGEVTEQRRENSLDRDVSVRRRGPAASANSEPMSQTVVKRRGSDTTLAYHHL